jgi:Serine-threonine protein kinase 19
MVMMSQLHSVFTNHTEIEREVASLISAGRIRKIMVREPASKSGAIGDFGIILSSSYVSMILLYGDTLQNFRNWVDGPGRAAVYVSSQELTSHDITMEDIQHLIEHGFLTLESSLVHSQYTVSVPGIGSLIKSLRTGRKDYLRALKRQPYHELLEKVPLP